MPFNLVIVIAPKIAFIDKDGNICLYKLGVPAVPTAPSPRPVTQNVDGDGSVSSSEAPAIIGRDRSESRVGTTALPSDNLEYLNSALTFDAGVQIVEEVIVKKHLEEVLQSLFNEEYICTKATIFDDVSDNAIQAMFICNEGENADMVITRLAHVGIGSLVGSVNVVSLETSKFYKRPPPPTPAADEKADLLNPNTKSESATLEEEDKDSEEEERQAQERKLFLAAASRIRVEQIVETITAGAVMRFDYLSLLTVSSTIAGIGLATNNTVAIVASMLVSPIMGPVLALTFGSVINDRELMTLGLRSELLSLLICILIGFVLGTFSILIGTDGLWPTSEMVGRGLADALAIGLGIAIPSGVGVALSVLGNNTSSLVGVAISASLLPPAVNCGICFAYAAFGFEADSGAVNDHSHYSTPESYIDLGGISLALTLVNIGAIYISGLVMFKIKEVAPLAEKAAFWQTDIETIRSSNREAHKRMSMGQSLRGSGYPTADTDPTTGTADGYEGMGSLNLNLNPNPFNDPMGAYALELFDIHHNRHNMYPSSPGLGAPAIPMGSCLTPKRDRCSASFAHDVLRTALATEPYTTPSNRNSRSISIPPSTGVAGGAAGSRMSLPHHHSKPQQIRVGPTQAELKDIKQRFRRKATARNFQKVETC